MNELVTYETYEQFKVALDTEILSAAESFVKIGYLLKQARDTTILHDSGYANLYEFAKAEYVSHKETGKPPFALLTSLLLSSLYSSNCEISNSFDTKITFLSNICINNFI